MIYPIVLSGPQEPGGCGAAESLPAHFYGEEMVESRFQSLLRGLMHPMFAAPTIVACEAHRFLAVQQMQAVGTSGELLIEPGLSNSAAALAAVALRFRHDPEATLLVLPADYSGADGAPFHHILEAALPEVFVGSLVLLTQEGRGTSRYGHAQPLCRARLGEPVQALFKDATSGASASAALTNAGVYMVRAGSLLAAFKRYAPRLLQSTKRAVEEIDARDGFLRLAPQAYDRVRREDFETAILARMETVVALPCEDPQQDPFADWYSYAQADRAAATRAAGQKPATGRAIAA